MTDLEITKLCAEAIGLPYKLDEDGEYCDSEGSYRTYWPLHDDAQAMVLLKKFELEVTKGKTSWHVCDEMRGETYGVSPDLNRAICECVSKVQVAKNESKAA